MIDEDEIDYPDPNDDDWYDDMIDRDPEREPNCFSCWDSGCRSCQPTWFQHCWWRLTWRIAARLASRRLRRNHPRLYDNEPPF